MDLIVLWSEEGTGTPFPLTFPCQGWGTLVTTSFPTWAVLQKLHLEPLSDIPIIVTSGAAFQGFSGTKKKEAFLFLAEFFG